jgi:predicted TIM-barrel fold metal-dependent hydrolase
MPAIPACPGPIADPKTPRFVLPSKACDCHFHVFGPYDRFPLGATRSYSPPETSVASYRKVMDTLGLERCVIVQPSVYGSDNSAILEAARKLNAPRACRIVAVIDESTPADAIERLHQAGVRGVRFNLVAGGGPDLDRIRNIARRIADRKWHIQIYATTAIIAEAAPMLADLDVDIVIDHFGSIAGKDLSSAQAKAIFGLVERGKAWVKLSGGYIFSPKTAPWSDMTAVARAFLDLRPDRIVWGTNWPHPVRYEPMPDDGDLVDAVKMWVEDETLIHRVMVENPARLYGFD